MIGNLLRYTCVKNCHNRCISDKAVAKTKRVYFDIACLVEVRLAGDNSRRNAGRLEVKYNYTWGTVCHKHQDHHGNHHHGNGHHDNDNDWDVIYARVACNMLGFGYFCILRRFTVVAP